MKIENPFSKLNILIVAPVILVMALDTFFTLFGQSESYWHNYNFFNEGSPLGQTLMLNPLYFISFMVVYIILTLILITSLKKPFNIILGIGLFLGHSWGSASWIPIIFYKLIGNHDINEWYLTISYFIIISIVSGLCVNKWLKIKILSKDKI